MKLHRLSVVHLNPIPNGWQFCTLEIGSSEHKVRIEVIPRQANTNKKKQLTATTAGWSVNATMLLGSLPDIDEKGRIVIPPEVRVPCEEAIEHVANLISVLEGCSRSILSPIPCIALQHENEQERKFLQESAGIRREVQSSEIGLRFSIPRSDAQLMASLSDRMMGVALLAEAYSGGGESAKYRDFVRFFELAFALSSSKIEKKLAKFLLPAMNYTRQEVRSWMEMRNPYSHADPAKGSFLASATDIRRFLLRMEQACLDVLFNKSKWMSADPDRRSVWIPSAISTSASGNVIAAQGSKVPAIFRAFDEFGVYPRDLGAVVTSFDSKTIYAKAAEST
jgi:hypothetical protein